VLLSGLLVHPMPARQASGAAGRSGEAAGVDRTTVDRSTVDPTGLDPLGGLS
jgi:hypothetical protein